MRKALVQTVIVLIYAIGCMPVWGAWTTQVYGPHTQVAISETDQVPESSGVIASRFNADIFWTHNDSGSGPRIWAFRLSAVDIGSGVAKHMGYVELTGASSHDWEDIAAGPGQTIYTFDGGDNPPCEWTNKRIHRIVEPTVDPDGPPLAMTIVYDSFRFEYPDSLNPAMPADSNDERYDAECLFVHPANGDVYVVTKRDNNDASAARVYKILGASIAWNSGSIHVLEFVADLSSAGLSWITGGDIDQDGWRVLIRSYWTGYEFILPQGLSFDEIFQQTPGIISLPGEAQGESICYDRGGGNLVTTSEATQFFPVYITPWQLANLRAESLQFHKATISWDTAETLDSRVDYGVTTGYGQFVSNPTSVNSHSIELADLLSGTQYFFKVTSGSLEYPEEADASNVFFITLPHLPAADFDEDGDVDQSDFGHLQACFSGSGVVQDAPACGDARLDNDLDVDNDDYVLFKACMSGPNVFADPHCIP